MDNVFLENDYPVLFTCKNKEKIYLCICRTVIEEQKWIVSEIDFEILQQLIENKISIYSAFKSNKGYCCIVRWKKSTQREEYTVIMSEFLSDEELPRPTVFLDDDGESIEYLEKVRNRLYQITQAKLEAYFDSEHDGQLYMARLSIKEERNDYLNMYSDVGPSNCNTTSRFAISHRNQNQNYDLIAFEISENNSGNVHNDNLMAA